MSAMLQSVPWSWTWRKPHRRLQWPPPQWGWFFPRKMDINTGHCHHHHYHHKMCHCECSQYNMLCWLLHCSMNHSMLVYCRVDVQVNHAIYSVNRHWIHSIQTHAVFWPWGCNQLSPRLSSARHRSAWIVVQDKQCLHSSEGWILQSAAMHTRREELGAVELCHRTQ